MHQLKHLGVLVTDIPLALAALKSIFPKPTAPFAIIFIDFDNFEIVSEFIGSVTELRIPSQSLEPHQLFLEQNKFYHHDLVLLQITHLSLSSFSLSNFLVTRIFFIIKNFLIYKVLVLLLTNP